MSENPTTPPRTPSGDATNSMYIWPSFASAAWCSAAARA